MSSYYKNIDPGFRSVRPFKLYKTWVLHTGSFTPFSATGEYSIYNGISPVDGGRNFAYGNYTQQLVDVNGYPLADTYALRDGTWYTPISESDVPYNYPNGFVAKYGDEGTTRYVDGLYQGAPTGAIEIQGHVARNLWYSAYNLFYRKGRDSRNVSGPPAVYDEEFSIRANIESSSIIIFNIPQNKFGESILPDSFELLMFATGSVPVPYTSSGNTSVDIDIRDDALGNLYDKESTAASIISHSIGNISYDYGLVFITDPEYYRYMSASFFENKNSGSVSMDFSYTSYYTAYEHEYICVVKAHEFNATDNITAYGPSAYDNYNNTRFLFDNNLVDQSGSSVNFRPLATGIGLFDDTEKLIAIAKFAKPIRIENDLDSVFIVRFDM